MQSLFAYPAAPAVSLATPTNLALFSIGAAFIATFFRTREVGPKSPAVNSRSAAVDSEREMRFLLGQTADYKTQAGLAEELTEANSKRAALQVGDPFAVADETRAYFDYRPSAADILAGLDGDLDIPPKIPETVKMGMLMDDSYIVHARAGN